MQTAILVYNPVLLLISRLVENLMLCSCLLGPGMRGSYEAADMRGQLGHVLAGPAQEGQISLQLLQVALQNKPGCRC